MRSNLKWFGRTSCTFHDTHTHDSSRSGGVTGIIFGKFSIPGYLVFLSYITLQTSWNYSSYKPQHLCCSIRKPVLQHAASGYSDQPAHPPSLRWAFVVHTWLTWMSGFLFAETWMVSYVYQLLVRKPWCLVT